MKYKITNAADLDMDATPQGSWPDVFSDGTHGHLARNVTKGWYSLNHRTGTGRKLSESEACTWLVQRGLAGEAVAILGTMGKTLAKRIDAMPSRKK